MLIPERGLHTGLITLVFSSVGWFSDYVLVRFVYVLIFFSGCELSEKYMRQRPSLGGVHKSNSYLSTTCQSSDFQSVVMFLKEKKNKTTHFESQLLLQFAALLHVHSQLKSLTFNDQLCSMLIYELNFVKVRENQATLMVNS